MTPAQAAYKAYAEVLVPLAPWGTPDFAQLPGIHQRAWEAVAQAVPAHALPAAPTPTPGQVAIDRDFFAHLLTCLASQKFLHEMAGSLDGETRQQANDMQGSIDVAWRRGMDLLQSPEVTP